MPSTEVSLIEGRLITTSKDFIQAKEAEIAEGERVIAELEQMPEVSPWKLARVRGRVRFLEHFIALMKEGFLPIPRMEFEPVDQANWQYDGAGRLVRGTTLVIDRLPVEAIAAINEFRPKFDRLGVVRPAGRGRKRDPFLIGIIQYGHLEEHFILAWWRPDIMRPTQLW
jgi:hypothetical protein